MIYASDTVATVHASVVMIPPRLSAIGSSAPEPIL